VIFTYRPEYTSYVPWITEKTKVSLLDFSITREWEVINYKWAIVSAAQHIMAEQVTFGSDCNDDRTCFVHIELDIYSASSKTGGL
jgi:hypothetical protein